jgi:hypothetical protein
VFCNINFLDPSIFLEGPKPLGLLNHNNTTIPTTSYEIDILQNKMNNMELGIEVWSTNKLSVEVKVETSKINGIDTKFRRVYIADGQYEIGWVATSDVTCCMICSLSFFRIWNNAIPVLMYRHHCRLVTV